MKLHELRIIQESVEELEGIIAARKFFTYDADKMKLAYPFDFDFTSDITVHDVKLKISTRLVAKFLHEAEEYYRAKLTAMGVEDLQYKTE
jgi:hypothetical protein